jgi:biopolymer transport protein TolR
MAATLGSGAKKSRRGRGSRQMSQINVTPLVDVMLVLLIIFMVTAPMITSGINIDLPETEATASRTDQQPLEISVDKNGKVFIAESEVSMENLSAKLEAIHKINPNKLVFVRGDQHVNYGRFAEVMGKINAAGFNKLTLLTSVK